MAVENSAYQGTMGYGCCPTIWGRPECGRSHDFHDHLRHRNHWQEVSPCHHFHRTMRFSEIKTDLRRAIWFQWMTAAVLSGQLLGPIIAGRLVSWLVWVPLFVSLGLILAGGGTLVAFTPETLPERLHTNSLDARGSETRWPSLQTLKALLKGPALWLFPGAVLTIPLATIQSDLLLRLMPLQFNWSLSHSALLISLRSLVTLVTLAIMLPVGTALWYRLVSRDLHHADFAMASGSCAFIMAGALCLVVITSETVLILGLILSAVGSGLPTLCRTMIVSWMEGWQIGSVFGILAMGEVIGFLAFELGMGALFGVGLRSWMGFPFCLGAALALVIGLATWLAPAPWLKNQDGQEV
ncbi:hypothetical protein BGZ63DRAFT_384310 [Mariannaea sp. PMI_226]|nr:hypothetical protein BGZ63DRAFT_384310 [Mariannaea sp. PMI_226]